jgi:hypothetical protein
VTKIIIACRCDSLTPNKKTSKGVQKSLGGLYRL